jgi:hypothetical protein
MSVCNAHLSLSLSVRECVHVPHIMPVSLFDLSLMFVSLCVHLNLSLYVSYVCPSLTMFLLYVPLCPSPNLSLSRGKSLHPSPRPPPPPCQTPPPLPPLSDCRVDMTRRGPWFVDTRAHTHSVYTHTCVPPQLCGTHTQVHTHVCVCLRHTHM